MAGIKLQGYNMMRDGCAVVLALSTRQLFGENISFLEKLDPIPEPQNRHYVSQAFNIGASAPCALYRADFACMILPSCRPSLLAVI